RTSGTRKAANPEAVSDSARLDDQWGMRAVKRWTLLGWVCVVYLSGLCFLLPLGSAVRPEGKACVLVPPRGGGSGVLVRHLTRGLARVHLIDVDLRTPGVSVRVEARHPSHRRSGWAVGDALCVEDWCRS